MRSKIIEKFRLEGDTVEIPLLKRGSFNAVLNENGILVDNLGSYSLLEWKVFEEIENLFREKGPKVLKGDAMNYKLGECGLGIDSVEGRIAYKIYNKGLGDSVFRRISSISGILIWVGICENDGKFLVVK